ncbi:hypothetical protein AB1Y20_021958 [Prymnesium parvum]|uniref:TsaA-like domain-containing protein n=1 Tax=Prymnesium parvum TaxID=97485 RepID=A0AB34JEY4_PRYPA
MADAAAVRSLAIQLKAARSEISKLHKRVNALNNTVKQELAAVRRDALRQSALRPSFPADPNGLVGQQVFPMAPIGYIESCFVYRNGTPRQPGLARAARSRLKVAWGDHPAHTTAGLDEFSHVWLLFVFHNNRGESVVKSKAKPPRLDGAAVGIFGCRTPHRPNAIGLSLVKLECVEGDVLHFRGADLIDGTPVLDVKPYLAYADAPPQQEIRCPEYANAHADSELRVHLTDRARSQLHEICTSTSVETCNRRRVGPRPLRFFANKPEEAEAAFVQLLQADPRSVYRKQKCATEVYRVCVDGIDAECTFDSASGDVTVHCVTLKDDFANVGALDPGPSVGGSCSAHTPDGDVDMEQETDF